MEATYSECTTNLPDGWNFVQEGAGDAAAAAAGMQPRPMISAAGTTPSTLKADHSRKRRIITPPSPTTWPWSRGSFQRRIQLQSEQSCAAADGAKGGIGNPISRSCNKTAVTWVDVTTTPASTISISYPELVGAADNAQRIVTEALQSRLEPPRPVGTPCTARNLPPHCRLTPTQSHGEQQHRCRPQQHQ